MRHRDHPICSATTPACRPAPLIAMAFACLWLAGCTIPQIGAPTERPAPVPTTEPPDGESLTAVAEQLVEEGQYTAAANAYEELAERAIDPGTQEHYRLTAIEVLFDNADYESGQGRMESLPDSLSSEDLAQRRQLLDARLKIVAGDPQGALDSLPDESFVVTPRALTRYHAVRADAATAAEQPGKALASLINLDLLEGGANRDERNLQIWDLLSAQETGTLEALFTAYEDVLPRGWLQLALDIDQVRNRRADIRTTTDAWKAQYPGHPADALLVAHGDDTSPFFAADSSRSLSIGAVNRVALLLPFTDRLQSFSGAIRDGAITTLVNSDTAITLQVYDVGDAASGALGAYQRAVADGADLVIGPLRRNAALALATSATLRVPVLSLNYLNDGNRVDNLIQFGLSPEDEARNAADFMAGNGLYAAAVLHPDTDAGLRSAQAFSDRLAVWGGQVLATEELPSNTTDFRQQLNRLLLINGSHARRMKLESALGTNMTFEAQHRVDIEAFFMPVSASLGRLVKPQLDFHGVAKVPVVSTSLIYGGRDQAEADRDIEGVYFNDIPWLINSASGEQNSRQSARTLGVDAGPLARFFALGSDAMSLALNLPQMINGEVPALDGHTGRLSLYDGRVSRRLPFAQFVKGVPQQTAFTYPAEPTPMAPEPAETDPLLTETDSADGAPTPAPNAPSN